MQVLILSRYGRLGASSRLRTDQYVPWLKAAGMRVQQVPFFDDQYLHDLYAGRRNRVGMLKYLARRLRVVLRARPDPDVIWLEKELIPWLPWALEKALFRRNIPVVSDYDDAVFHRYDMHGKALIRAVLGDKIDHVMGHSATVIAGNTYLADRARSAGASRVEIVPTVVNLDDYRVPDHQPSPPVIGWIGSPSTWAEYLQPMLPLLEDLAGGNGARVHAVGAAKGGRVGPHTQLIGWTEDSEVAEIQRMSLGIMPLNDTPWAKGKCGYKLIQYMACGVPVIAAPVGVNQDIVSHGENGFLAKTETQWREAIETLLSDPDRARRMGQAGRKLVEKHYSLQVQAPRVVQILQDAGRKGG